MPEQFHHLLGALLHGDNRQCIESPMGFATISFTEKALTLTICDCILRFRSKRVLFYVNFTFVDINIELRHNVPSSQRSNNEQERVKNLKLRQSTFCRPGGVPIKHCEIAIYLHFHVYVYIYIYIYIYMKTSQIFVKFSLRKSYQTMPLYQNCPKDQSAKRAKYYQQTSHNFNKAAVCSHRHHRGMFVQGYTFGSSIQVRATPQPSSDSAPR